MPLQDHFHSPWSDDNPWEGFHSAWVNTLVRHLNGQLLPRRFRAFPQVLPAQDVFEVRVVNESRASRLVAAIELVSPANKDRPESRRAFVARCAAYLQERVNLLVVDVVTSRHMNLHRELLELFSLPQSTDDENGLYAVSYRSRKEQKWHLDTWPVMLTLGAALPTMPLWLTGNFAVPLDLEKSYAETCQVLRIE
jgi:hypothetical protein